MLVEMLCFYSIFEKQRKDTIFFVRFQVFCRKCRAVVYSEKYSKFYIGQRIYTMAKNE
jgi:hypothetical protein